MKTQANFANLLPRFKLQFLLIGLFCAPCHALELGETVLESATVVGAQLQLLDSNGVCTLIHKQNGSVTRLALVPQVPCFFLRNSTAGQVQQFAYPEPGIKATLIVAGTAISDARRKKHGIAPEPVCGSVMQGILLSKNKVSASADVLNGGIACRDTGRDEKDFWFFAHPQAYRNRRQ